MSATFNAVKDGYLSAINWIVAHPHTTLWSSVGAIVLVAIIL